MIWTSNKTINYFFFFLATKEQMIFILNDYNKITTPVDLKFKSLKVWIMLFEQTNQDLRKVPKSFTFLAIVWLGNQFTFPAYLYRERLLGLIVATFKGIMYCFTFIIA